MVGGSLIAYQSYKLKELQRSEMNVLAAMVEEMVAELMLVEDGEGINNVLRTIRFRQDIKKVLIVSVDNEKIALYAKEGEYPGDYYRLINNELHDSEIMEMKQIKLDGRLMGRLYLVADKNYIKPVINDLILSFVFNLLIGLVVVYLIAINIQKMISSPLNSLKETVRAIINDKNYEIRTDVKSQDEIGELTDEFNEMLDVLNQSSLEIVRNEKKFRKVLEQSADMYLLINSKGSIVDVNNSSCLILGYTRDEIINKTWPDVDSGCKGLVVVSSVIKQLKNSKNQIVESEFITKSKKLIPVVINIGVLADQGDDLIVVSAKDNTDAVMSERKLKQANDELEAKVNERTIELKRANLELSFAKEKAVAASKAKSLFLANMSHEIRTPMNSVIGFTDVLSSSGLNEVQKSYVESIRAGSRNLLSLINDILDISKIEAGKMKVKYDAVFLKNLLVDVVEVFSITAREKGLKLALDFNDEVPEVILSDEVRLRQIIFNLVNNAIKFTKKGGVTIVAEIEKGRVSERSFDVIIKICDTGIGINKEDQQKIFNMFEQQDGQNTREYGGAGLGLAISKRLAGRLNSTLMVDSEKGKGSCFILRMNNPELISKGANLVEKTDIEKISLKPVRVLVADDVEENRFLIKEYLSSQPIDILFANNGEEAVNMLREEEVDIVLMDIRMPKKSGIDAIKEIRADKSISSIPVIAVTASFVGDGVEERQEVLFDDVVLKPIKKESLLKAISAFSGYNEIDESTGSMSEGMLLLEMQGLNNKALNEINKYMPVIERAKSRGSFGELEELLDKLMFVAEKNRLPELKRYLKMIYTSNQRFDVEETNVLISKIVFALSFVDKEEFDDEKA